MCCHREENDALIKVNNQLRSEVADLKAKVESARHAKDRMGQVIAEAANAIKDLIQVVSWCRQTFLLCYRQN